MAGVAGSTFFTGGLAAVLAGAAEGAGFAGDLATAAEGTGFAGDLATGAEGAGFTGDLAGGAEGAGFAGDLATGAEGACFAGDLAGDWGAFFAGVALAAGGGVLDFTNFSEAADFAFGFFSTAACFLGFGTSTLDFLADFSEDDLVEGME